MSTAMAATHNVHSDAVRPLDARTSSAGSMVVVPAPFVVALLPLPN